MMMMMMMMMIRIAKKNIISDVGEDDDYDMWLFSYEYWEVMMVMRTQENLSKKIQESQFFIVFLSWLLCIICLFLKLEQIN